MLATGFQPPARRKQLPSGRRKSTEAWLALDPLGTLEWIRLKCLCRISHQEMLPTVRKMLTIPPRSKAKRPHESVAKVLSPKAVRCALGIRALCFGQGGYKAKASRTQQTLKVCPKFALSVRHALGFCACPQVCLLRLISG